MSHTDDNTLRRKQQIAKERRIVYSADHDSKRKVGMIKTPEQNMTTPDFSKTMDREKLNLDNYLTRLQEQGLYDGGFNTEDKLRDGKEFAGVRRKEISHGIISQQGITNVNKKERQVYEDSLRQDTESEDETDFDFMREGRRQLFFNRDDSFKGGTKSPLGTEQRKTVEENISPGIEMRSKIEEERPRVVTMPDCRTDFVKQEIEPIQFLQRALQDFETQLMEKVCKVIKVQNENMFSKHHKMIDERLSVPETERKVDNKDGNNLALYWATREQEMQQKEAVLAQKEESLTQQELQMQQVALEKESVGKREQEMKMEKRRIRDKRNTAPTTGCNNTRA